MQNPTHIHRRELGMLAAATILSTAPAMAGTASQVVAIVRVPSPWYAPRMLITKKMRDTIPTYERVPGLAFKAFSYERESHDYGGIYYWQSQAQASEWFNPAWFGRVKAERGADGQVRFFESPLSLDNTPGGTQAQQGSEWVATLVQIPLPPQTPKERMKAEFQRALPQYRTVPGLLRKHFILSESGTFGGLYLWQDQRSARDWFGEAWHQRVKQTYGHEATMEWFDVPILLPSLDPANAIPSGALVVASR